MARVVREGPRRSRRRRLQVIIEVDEDGRYVASCPALQGCHTQGDTFEEALANVHDVIKLCLEEIIEEQGDVDLRFPEVVGIKTVEVTV